MRRFYSIVCVLSHLTICQLTTTDFPDKSTLQENRSSMVSTSTIYSTTTSWYSTEQVTPPGSTRLPQLLRLGNQTVDINKSFKVPQMGDDPTKSNRSVTNIIAVNQTLNSDIVSKTVLTNKSEVAVNNSGSGPKQGSVVTVSSVPKSWQGTKHEHEGRYGPQFEDGAGENSTVVIQSGDTALFDCRVSLLRDKTVSWLKRQPGEPPRLLTVGAQTYTGDTRFTVQFRYPGNWRLKISPTNTSDEGLYECQLSTHPPRVISVYLQVRSMTVAIVDESGEPLREQYYEAGSTLSLRCRVRGGGSEVSAEGAVWWLHGTRALHRDAQRGGVGVRSVALKDGNGADSTLRVSRLAPSDAGNYTCAVPHAMHYAYTVLVHVLNESLAELQQGSSNEGPRSYLILMAAAAVIAMAFAQNAPS